MALLIVLVDEAGEVVGSWAEAAYLPCVGDEIQLHPDDQEGSNLAPENGDQPDSDERPVYEVVRIRHKPWIYPQRRKEPMFDGAYRDDIVTLHIKRKPVRHPNLRTLG